jgi:hypothetical protein
MIGGGADPVAAVGGHAAYRAVDVCGDGAGGGGGGSDCELSAGRAREQGGGRCGRIESLGSMIEVAVIERRIRILFHLDVNEVFDNELGRKGSQVAVSGIPAAGLVAGPEK